MTEKETAPGISSDVILCTDYTYNIVYTKMLMSFYTLDLRFDNFLLLKTKMCIYFADVSYCGLFLVCAGDRFHDSINHIEPNPSKQFLCKAHRLLYSRHFSFQWI